MANLITKQKDIEFNVGDRVEFKVIDQPDNYSPSWKTMYGIVLKVNKVTMEITGVNGLTYKATRAEVKSYQDPFANINKI